MDLSWGCTAGRPARPGPTAARHPAPAQSACAPRESAGRESDLVGSDCCDRWMSVRDLLAVPSLGLRLLTAPDAMLRRNVAPRYAPRPNDGCSSSQRGFSTRWADSSTDEVQTRVNKHLFPFQGHPQNLDLPALTNRHSVRRSRSSLRRVCRADFASARRSPRAHGRNAADECVSLEMGAGDTRRVRLRGSASPKAARVTLGVTRR